MLLFGVDVACLVCLFLNYVLVVCVVVVWLDLFCFVCVFVCLCCVLLCGGGVACLC